MARRAGNAGAAWIGTPDPPTANDRVLGLKSWALDIDSDALESTGMDSLGNRFYVAGLGGWKGSLEILWDTTSLNVTEPRELTTGTQLFAIFKVSVTAGNTYEAHVAASGSVLITRSSPNVTVDGIVTCTVDFVGNGELIWPTAG